MPEIGASSDTCGNITKENSSSSESTRQLRDHMSSGNLILLFITNN